MPRVIVNGWKFLCRQAGAGLDVVLLPGMANADSSRELFDSLAEDFHVTIYEPRDHAASRCPSADMADDLRGLQDKLNLGPSYLVGHRFGAVTALHAAVLYPDMTAGLVLSEPCFPDARPERGSALTTQRFFLIEQPVVLLCGEDSPFRGTCHFLQENLSNCRTALVPGDDGPALAASIRAHLRDMAGANDFQVAGPRTCGSRPRGMWARMLPEEGDGRSVARWMARMSAWMW